MKTKLRTETETDLLDELIDLICINLQLNDGQVDKAKTSYSVVGDWLRAPQSLVRSFRPDIFPQGSLRLDTTVRPMSHTEFDLDLVCLVDISDTVTPASVYELLLSRVRDSRLYGPMVVEMPRCIRLDYAGNFHLDIVPAVPDPNSPAGETWIKIPDRELKIWRESNPRGYSRWFDGRSKIRKLTEKKAVQFSVHGRMEPLVAPTPALSKAPLRLAVQLLKRWRDVAFKGREKLAPSSIVLTTLAAELYEGDHHPTVALLNILSGICAKAGEGKIHLVNPSNPAESVTDRWVKDPQSYQAFIDGIVDFHTRWQKMVYDGTFPQMIKDLKELFDEAPVTKALTKFGERRETARKADKLVVECATGTIRMPALVAAPVAASLPVKDHRFHGAE